MLSSIPSIELDISMAESMFKRPLCEISIVGREDERQDLGSCAGW